MVVVNGVVVDGMSVCECVIMLEQYLCRLCCCWQTEIEMVVGLTRCCSPVMIKTTGIADKILL